MNLDNSAKKRNSDWPIVGDALPKRGNWLTKTISRTLLRLFGWRIAGEISNSSKMVLIGAPHTSNWDFILTVATMFALGARFSWVAKHSLFKRPIGGIMEWLGGVRLNRQTSEGFVEQMVEEFNNRDQLLLALMPEGTRAKVKGWRSGFYFIALQAQVPMLAVIFDYGQKQLRLGPTFHATGDVTADLPHIQSFYAGVKGKHSDQ
ncbi:MAG: acyltransferase [Chloroflexi bacterium]|nr:acyltransferase [Chloroflexota bacterium]